MGNLFVALPPAPFRWPLGQLTASLVGRLDLAHFSASTHYHLVALSFLVRIEYVIQATESI